MPLIAFSKGNLAGETIAKSLIGKHGFLEKPHIKSGDGKYEWRSWEKNGLKLVELTTLHIFSDYLKDYPLFNDADLLIVASTHKSETNSPAVTAHTCGNFGAGNKLGGNPNELAHSSASALKIASNYLSSHPLEGFPFSMEATHHGPTPLKAPILFVEIGSTDKEFANEVAGDLFSDCIMEVCNKWKKGQKASPEAKTAIGFGGTHYCSKFSRLMLEQNYEFAYVCSKHNLDEVTPEIVKQAMEKSAEKLEVALIEKKSMNAATRDKLISILKEVNLPHEIV
ncbi:MAG: D-aminoacyl-tRNA deacylase [Candidatus Micrarchaeota archaeon]